MAQNTQPKQQPPKKKPRKRKVTVPCIVSVGLLLLAQGVLLALLWQTQWVPAAYLALGAAAALLLCAVVFVLTNQAQTARRVAGIVLASVLVAVSFAAGFYVWRTLRAVRAVSDSAVERASVTFYTLQEHPAQTLDELAGGTFGILKALDRANTDVTLQQVEQEHQLTLATVEYDSLTQLADALL